MAKKKNWYTNKRKFHFIYKTICSVNGKYYYGMHSTDNLEDGYVGSGTRLWHSIKKHGRENFKLEILEFCVDRESLKQREAELITEEKLKDPMCMNLTLGGNGGCSIESQIKRSSAGGKASYIANSEKIREQGSSVFKRLHQEGKMRYDGFSGKTHTEEARKRIGEAGKLRSGENNHQFGKKWAWVNNGTLIRKIPREQLDEFVRNGWKHGTKTVP
jgi:hypothetical protein